MNKIEMHLIFCIIKFNNKSMKLFVVTHGAMVSWLPSKLSVSGYYEHIISNTIKSWRALEVDEILKDGSW